MTLFFGRLSPAIEAKPVTRNLVAAVAATALLFAPSPAAFAHGSNEGVSDEEHAAIDLVGKPMNEIEKETNARAVEIEARTGKEPGAAEPEEPGTGARMAAAAVGDPGEVGTWGDVVDTDVVPVFQAGLPDGKVLIWDSVGDNATETYPNHTFTRAMVWDPTNNTSKRVDVSGYNIFCAGFTSLIDGNILVAGGNKNPELEGIVQTHIFNWRTQTWSRGPDMAADRWYPSVTALNNGDAAILGGGPNVAEVYQRGSNSIRRLTGFTHYSDRIYPYLVTRPDAKIQLMGPLSEMETIKTAGTGAITRQDNRDNVYRGYGSMATYAIGKTLLMGGSPADSAPTNSAVIVNTNGGGASTTATGSMAIGRRQLTATVLADGSVLATGGSSSNGGQGLVDLDNATTAAERWDPATGRWTELASATRVRQYHSSATLLPDGRVLTGGGGICGPCTWAGYLEKNVEVFTPPYLYKKDGSGELADRPQITGGPTFINFNTPFQITSPQAADIKKVGLIRLGASTHGVEQSQRYVQLDYTVTGDTINTRGPANGGVAPPGYYMLVITNSAGVPSVAKIMRALAGTAPIATAIKNVSGKCVDVPGGDTTDGTDLWMHNCAASQNQMWTQLGDKTLRALGKCMEITDNIQTPGTFVQLSGCTGSTGQQWTRSTSDLSIRLTAQPNLCLAVVDGSRATKAKLEIRTCNGSSAQKFTW